MQITTQNLSSDNLDVVGISGTAYERFYITAHPDADGSTDSMFAKVADFARERDARIVTQYVFGGCDLHGSGIPEIERTSGGIAWPVTWIQGDGASGAYLTGTQAFAVRGIELEPVYLDGRVVGNLFDSENARCCLLGDLGPTDLSRSREEQARETFERMDAALKTVGMDFSNVVRTWLYLDKLLTWYDEFNEVRTTFFNEYGVFDNLVPASTGIGVSNPAGAALVSDVFAIQPKNGGVNIEAVPSPLQCPAIDYKSSFSRGVEISSAAQRFLLISGTASIHPGGETAHVGDVRKQIALTMEVIDAILKSRDMSWENTVRGIAYFRNGADAPLYEEYCRQNGLPALPMAIAHADICRDDLLVEVEIDAVAAP